jgi:hypothetical protein
MSRFKLAFVLPFALLATACADVQMASPQEDQLGKRFEPPPSDKGALYLYRSGLLGALKPVGVAVSTNGGGLNVALAPDTWVRLEGEPGPIEVRCLDDQTGQRFDVGPGETRYVEVSYRIGLMSGGCGVAEVSSNQGQRGVAGGKRAIAGGQAAGN